MRKTFAGFVCGLLVLVACVCNVKGITHIAMMNEDYLKSRQQIYEKIIKEAEKKKQEQKKEKETPKARQVSGNVTVKKAPSYGVSAEEFDLLCKICHAESRGEGEKGQMAVANVILNRVKSGQFPNSIKGVIMQGGQFTPASSKNFMSIKPSAQVVASVEKVLKGERVLDDDVLYFKSTSSSAKWNKLKLRTQIGRHLFYAK